MIVIGRSTLEFTLNSVIFPEYAINQSKAGSKPLVFVTPIRYTANHVIKMIFDLDYHHVIS